MSATYAPEIFEVPDVEAAKRLVVTQEGDLRSEVRWERETPYLVDLIAEQLGELSGKLIIDYGCGIGRVAKPLIEKHGCRVLGVDFSPAMRSLAPQHVGHTWFSVVSRGVLEGLVQAGFRADAAFSVWVLQHCLRPAEDVALMASALRPGGGLVVVNNKLRAVPVREGNGYANDGIDIDALVQERFARLAGGEMDPQAVGENVATATFWASYALR